MWFWCRRCLGSSFAWVKKGGNIILRVGFGIELDFDLGLGVGIGFELEFGFELELDLSWNLD